MENRRCPLTFVLIQQVKKFSRQNWQNRQNRQAQISTVLDRYDKLFLFSVSLFNYLVSEVTRGYVLENDEERYTHRREKMYTFMKIPRELEKFMSYGFFHCLDSFLFVFTFLPIRCLLAFTKLIVKTPLSLLR